MGLACVVNDQAPFWVSGFRARFSALGFSISGFYWSGFLGRGQVLLISIPCSLFI